MNFWRQRGLAFKLSLLILGGVGLVLVVILTMNYQATHRLMVEKIEENAFNLARATANRIDTVLKAAEKVPGDLGETLVVLEPGESQLKSLLRGGCGSIPNCLVFAPPLPRRPARTRAPIRLGRCAPITMFGTASASGKVPSNTTTAITIGIRSPRSWPGRSGASPISASAAVSS
jgi:hypothetical protein